MNHERIERPDSISRWHYFPSRTLCEVIEEIRKCYNSRNFAPILGLAEEIQILGNRMEAGLDLKHNFKEGMEKLHTLRTEYKELQSQYIRLRQEYNNIVKTVKPNESQEKKS